MSRLNYKFKTHSACDSAIMKPHADPNAHPNPTVYFIQHFAQPLVAQGEKDPGNTRRYAALLVNPSGEPVAPSFTNYSYASFPSLLSTVLASPRVLSPPQFF